VAAVVTWASAAGPGAGASVRHRHG